MSLSSSCNLVSREDEVVESGPVPIRFFLERVDLLNALIKSDYLGIFDASDFAVPVGAHPPNRPTEGSRNAREPCLQVLSRPHGHGRP
jgi:hypothetical protein